MRLHKLLELVEDLTPTGYRTETLTAWIEQCENGILVDVLLLDPAECVTLDPETDVELAVKKPYEKLYLPYVQAQVAFAQGEISRYENYLALYTAYLDEYARYICRTVYPAGGCSKLSGYYLSAYGLAVENGFEGTETDWLASLVGPQGGPGPQGPAGEPGREMPIAWASYSDGIYTAAGEDLPEVAAGSESEWVGKGRQMILVPMSQSGPGPKLRINEGEPIEIRRRADTQTLTEPVDQLMRGVPYVLLFCGLYWLVESPMIGRSDIAAMIAGIVAGVARSVNGKVPDASGSVVINSNDVLMSTGRYEDFTEEPITDVVDQLGMRIDAAQSTAEAAQTTAENAQTTAENAQTTAENAQTTAENAQTAANAARTLAVTAVRSVNSKPPTGGNVELRSNDIKMDDGDTYDWGGFTITEALDFIYNEKGGKIQLVYNGTDLRYVSGAPVTFASLKTLLLSNPAFVFLTYNNWAYLTTYIYEPQGGSQYQYIRFSSTVIGTDSDGAKRAKTSSIIVESTNGVSISHIGHSNIDSENASNRANNMNVINDTLYPTTKAVADYVAAQLAAIPWAEEEIFNG